MAIIFHENSKTFHIFNDKLSYIIRVIEDGQLENLYYGAKIHDREDFNHLHNYGYRSHMSIDVDDPMVVSPNHTRLEYASYGAGDYRAPSVTVRQSNGSRITAFKYKSHNIYKGKKAITPLPATYVESDDEATTLEVIMYDDICDTELKLVYTIYEERSVITRHAEFVQLGQDTVYLERALSMNVDFLDMDYDMVQLSGSWARERYVKERHLEMGIQAVQGLDGTGSGAEHNPFFALKRKDATENSGEVYGFSLVYSGNFLAQVEVSTFDITRVMMGINPQNFEWKLEKGDIFITPEVVMVYSSEGLNGMSQTYHDLYRKRLVRGYWRDKARPILLNNWEATFMDFDEDKILDIARKGKEVGVELFVLDDGWFGARNDDYRGLGDWQVNLNKLPSGITGLARQIEDMGMKFGLWVELEMVNKDSDLYREHPDWIISAPGRYECHCRHQHVLDFTRPEVVDYIYESIHEVISTASISYIKWDMNRYMSEPYGKKLPVDRQGEFMHRYILGVYDLYTRLTNDFPQILFESCASGGARFDPGMMFFAPQAWCSDDTDAAERVKIQYGTSLVYPLVSIGAHVSAVPNDQINRITPIESRANVAYFGTFGYELDLNLLEESELNKVKKQIEFMKVKRELIQIDGDFYRLISPFEHNDAGWIVVGKNKKEAVALYYQRLNKVNPSWKRFKLTGLDPELQYNISYEIGNESYNYMAYGDELMNAGVDIDSGALHRAGGDFTSIIFSLQS